MAATLIDRIEQSQLAVIRTGLIQTHGAALSCANLSDSDSGRLLELLMKELIVSQGDSSLSSSLPLPPAEFTLRTRTRSNPVQPLSARKRTRNHLLDSSLFGFRSFAGPDPRAQDFSAFSPPQQELSRPRAPRDAL